MVMESESMMVGDDVGGGDDEKSLETPLSWVESRINLTHKTRSWSRRRSVSRNIVSFQGDQFLGYIRHLAKASFGPHGSPLVIQSSRALPFVKNFRCIFPQFYFQQLTKRRLC
jgi:hypothetical protein